MDMKTTFRRWKNGYRRTIEPVVTPPKEPAELWWEHIMFSNQWRSNWKSINPIGAHTTQHHPFEKWCWFRGYDVGTPDGRRSVYHIIGDSDTNGIQQKYLNEIRLIDTLFRSSETYVGTDNLPERFLSFLSTPAVEDRIREKLPSFNVGYMHSHIGSLLINDWFSVPTRSKALYLYSVARPKQPIENGLTYIMEEMLDNLIQFALRQLRGISMLDPETIPVEKSFIFRLDGHTWKAYHNGCALPLTLGGEPDDKDYISSPFYKFKGADGASQTAVIVIREARGNWLLVECDRQFNIVGVRERTTGNYVSEFMLSKGSGALPLFRVNTPITHLVK